MDLSIIIPYVNEWPQLIWTLRSVAEELEDTGVKYEVIAIDNYCDQVRKQGKDAVLRLAEKTAADLGATVNIPAFLELVKTELGFEPDKGGPHIENVAKMHDWLVYAKYDEKLSHWNAKRVGVEMSTGRNLLFMDAHCSVGRGAINRAYHYFDANALKLDGTLHMPVTYQILEKRKLIYKLNPVDLDKGLVHYQFSQYKDLPEPYEVPCMSTCGMFITRQMYEYVGGWPSELGIYGGGENFMNFTLSVLGKKKWIMPGNPLYHHGDRRGYDQDYTDTLRNRAIAAFIYGGYDWMELFVNNCEGRRLVKQWIIDDVSEKCAKHRKNIKQKQVKTIQEWVPEWRTI
jgi:hypothetical protein